MRLAVLGATGSVGRELVAQALAAGHEVTALVREQPKPGEIDDRVALVARRRHERRGREAHGRRKRRGRQRARAREGRARRHPRARATANVIAAMRADGVEQARRAVVARRCRRGRPAGPLLPGRARLVMRVAIASVVRDHREQARLIEESGLAWTIVRGPLVFTDGPRTGRYHAGPIGRDSGPRISRADLADVHARNRDRRRLRPDEAARQPLGGSRCCRSPTDSTRDGSRSSTSR